MKNTLVEVWQANAGGRYRHKKISIWRPSTRISAAAAGC
jgi:protocatechuate 3,4-dioxygenase beta subunit